MTRGTISELADDEVYTSLQSRLNRINDSPKKRDARGDEIVSLLELTSRVQGRLFEALQEEGVNDHKVIPLMAAGRLGIPSHRVSEATELKLAKENLDKTRELEDTKRAALLSQHKLETRMLDERAQARLAAARTTELESKLQVANKTLDLTDARLLNTEKQLNDLRLDNSLLKTAPASYLSKYYPSYYPYYYNALYDRYNPYYNRYGLTGRYYGHGHQYYDYYLDREYYKAKYDSEYAKLKTDLALSKYLPLPSTPYLAGVAGITNDARRRRLIDRYADIFTSDRLSVQKLLRNEISDEDTIKRVIYTSVVESFKSAQRSFRDQRRRARTLLSATTLLPTLESEIQDYMVKNKDLYDPESAVFDVVRTIESNPAFPVNVNYRKVLRSIIKELAIIAYEMQTVGPELDIEVGLQGDVFSDAKFRRTFDADFGAPLVAAHLWPCLVNGDDGGVVLKGEAATRHSVFSRPISTGRKGRSKSRVRSASPVRGLRTRNKSPVKH